METKTQTYGPVYATSSRGDVKMWSALVEETLVATRITYTYGLENGKKQTQKVYVKKGKNIGRANETTHYEQAIKMVESKLNAKKDKGYGTDIDNIETPILPMLALPFTKRKHNIKYPAFVQPKIDGVRMTCRLVDGQIEMFTRKGKSFAVMPHIEKELVKILNDMPKHFYLDGELYSDTLTFQEVAGTVRRIKKVTDSEILNQISYKVFDCFCTQEYHLENDTFRFRLETLKTLFVNHHMENTSHYLTDKAGNKTLVDRRLYKDGELTSPVTLIETLKIQSESEVYEMYDMFMRSGAEGIMIRNADGLYKLNHRSADLQKYKQFKDSEYKIIDFTEGSNNEKNAVVWVCETKDGYIFNVRPKGTIEGRRILFELGDKNIGKMLTVRYQELTDDGIPRFPVGISIRDYE
tara:strand:- start:475 stop:1701 length:1227 start_codon:yes stop_codon:yes gene_type:complete